MTTVVYSADGVSVIDSFTTPAITSDGNHTSPSGFIEVYITNYGPDSAPKFQAQAEVEIDVVNLLASVGLVGGRMHVVISHTTDTTTDGGVVYTYTEPDVFYDYGNPPNPSINGTVSMVENVASLATKHLSGIEYYTLGSLFISQVVDIDNLNSNTQRISSSLQLVGTEYGLETLDHSPFGVGGTYFSGWSNNHDQQDISYRIPLWGVTVPSHRYMGPTASVSAMPRDSWVDGVVVNSSDASILVDTYPSASTSLFEDFDDEDYREDPSSFPGVGSWNEAATLSPGDAIVFNGQLMAPRSTTFVRDDGPDSANSNWAGYKPDSLGANPDYSAPAYGVPAEYGRRFSQAGISLLPSFSMVFTGDFSAGTAFDDLLAGNFEIEVYRIAGSGNIGPPPGNTFPLRVHEPFNFALWDDGLTVPGSGIREGSSSGDTINCTFGTGTPAQSGFYCVFRILDLATRIDSVTVTFF